MKTISKRHFATFKKCCERWLAALHLTDWVITITHVTESDALTYASTSLQLDTKDAIINLNTKWDFDSPVTTAMLEQTALHEVCHVLLAKLVKLAESRECFPGAIDTEEHEVIRNICLGLQDKT